MSFKLRAPTLWALVSSLALNACSQQNARAFYRGEPPELIESRHAAAIVPGRMESTYLAVLAEDNPLEDCDREHKQDILDLMRTLDARTSARSNTPEQRLPEQEESGITIGPGHFIYDGRESLAAATMETPEDWASSTRPLLDWMLETYLPLVRENRMSDADWVFVEQYFTSRVLDDSNRLRARANFRQHPGNQRVMEELWQAFQSCATDDCIAGNVLERLSPEAQTLVEEVPSYANLAAQIREEPSNFVLQAELGASFFKWINRDIKIFRPKQSLRRVSASNYRLTLDPGVFSEDRARMAGVIEYVWRKDDRRVMVDWGARSPLETVMNYLLIWTPERGRAHVLHDVREARFFIGSSVTTIAHEIGHVIGFPDYYYTMWNPRACSYTQISSTTDLMSAGGRLHPKRWEALDQAFPNWSPR